MAYARNRFRVDQSQVPPSIMACPHLLPHVQQLVHSSTRQACNPIINHVQQDTSTLSICFNLFTVSSAGDGLQPAQKQQHILRGLGREQKRPDDQIPDPQLEARR